MLWIINGDFKYPIDGIALSNSVCSDSRYSLIQEIGGFHHITVKKILLTIYYRFRVKCIEASLIQTFQKIFCTRIIGDSD